jgi:hypothetical protein
MIVWKLPISSYFILEPHHPADTGRAGLGLIFGFLEFLPFSWHRKVIVAQRSCSRAGVLVFRGLLLLVSFLFRVLMEILRFFVFRKFVGYYGTMSMRHRVACLLVSEVVLTWAVRYAANSVGRAMSLASWSHSGLF